MKSYLRATLAGTTLGLAIGTTLIGAPAQAEVTHDCRLVSVNLTDRADNGSHGVWARDTMTRTVKVCRGNEALVEGKSTYYATVTDKGTFVTVDGKSPKAGLDLVAGIKGTVNGGFSVTKFTAPTWVSGFALTAPAASTSSPDWVAVAFPGSNATISTYKWVYKTDCESYTDNNGTYTGDITKKCATPPPTVKDCAAYVYTGTRENLCAAFPNPTGKVNCSDVKYRVTLVDAKNDPWGLDGNQGVKGVGCESNPLKPKATPSPSHSRSVTPAPSRSTTAAAAGGLPVTGPKVSTMIVAGGALVGVGAVLLVGRRRRAKFEA